MAALALAAPAGAGTGERSLSRKTALEVQIVAQINALRSRHGLAPLRLSRDLGAAAGAHSTAMVRRGFFAHESADGSAFWKRIERFYRPGGSARWSVGENLLWASPSVDARGAVAQWLRSPGHRRNMLDPSWREIGLGAVHAPSAPGVFDGLDVTVVTADFGVR